jgi:hypothetical protein
MPKISQIRAMIGEEKFDALLKRYVPSSYEADSPLRNSTTHAPSMTIEEGRLSLAEAVTRDYDLPGPKM